MMMSPESYVQTYENTSFPELIKARNEMIREIRRLEKLVFSEDRIDDAWLIKPSPDVQYQVYLEYLEEMCKMMREKYSKEYVWKDEEDDRIEDDE